MLGSTSAKSPVVFTNDPNTARQPVAAATDRLDNALVHLHSRLEVLATKLTPVLHSQIPQTNSAEPVPASDVGLVRELDDATARVTQAVRIVDDLIDRAAV